MKAILGIFIFLFSLSIFASNSGVFYCEKNEDETFKVMRDYRDDYGRIIQKGLISSDVKLTDKECSTYAMKKNKSSNMVEFYCDKNLDDTYKIMADYRDNYGRIIQKGLISSDIKLTGKECLDYVMGKF